MTGFSWIRAVRTHRKAAAYRKEVALWSQPATDGTAQWLEKRFMELGDQTFPCAKSVLSFIRGNRLTRVQAALLTSMLSDVVGQTA